MEEQVKQIMAMLAQMDTRNKGMNEKMVTRMEKMGEKMDSKGKQWMKK